MSDLDIVIMITTQNQFQGSGHLRKALICIITIRQVQKVTSCCATDISRGVVALVSHQQRMCFLSMLSVRYLYSTITQVAVSMAAS